jgi:hypothetical protein
MTERAVSFWHNGHLVTHRIRVYPNRIVGLSDEGEETSEYMGDRDLWLAYFGCEGYR